MVEPGKDLFDRDARSDPYLAEYKRVVDLLWTSEWRPALKELEGLARNGSIMSILLIADLIRAGRMYERDLPGAEEWYRIAVETGSARGHFGLGLTYRDMGRLEDAVRELEVAIARNFPPALNALAVMYFRGEAGLVDRPKALDLWRRGASLGHIPSKRNLVEQYVHGSYGLWRRILGNVAVLPVAIEIGKRRRQTTLGLWPSLQGMSSSIRL
jgi:tetratricopeptide (TPR) repeat protein